MCRLFGFRSVIPSQVHRSLVAADNALGSQSRVHPDGWGVAYYIDGAPHVTRSAATALHDHLFHRVSGIVSSETVVAHVRKATVGDISVLNCHPFQYGRWVFAHNGDIPNFEKYRKQLLDEIAPQLRRFILGETDSEVVFFLFLSTLLRYGPLGNQHAVEDVSEALAQTVKLVRGYCDESAEKPSLLTLLVTNGSTMAATQGGKELFWSTYKRSCSDREVCPSLSHECEHPSETGFVNHLIFSSEPLGGENIWLGMHAGEMIGVDWRMRVLRRSLDGSALPDVAHPEGIGQKLVTIGSTRSGC